MNFLKVLHESGLGVLTATFPVLQFVNSVSWAFEAKNYNLRAGFAAFLPLEIRRRDRRICVTKRTEKKETPSEYEKSENRYVAASSDRIGKEGARRDGFQIGKVEHLVDLCSKGCQKEKLDIDTYQPWNRYSIAAPLSLSSSCFSE